jgi:hypothetical protein
MDVLGERILEAKRDGATTKVTVRLGLPVRQTHTPEYRCSVQIVGLGPEINRFASGEDAIQALELALKLIGIELHSTSQAIDFSWLGFPGTGFEEPK